jgi:hypothetical protein
MTAQTAAGETAMAVAPESPGTTAGGRLDPPSPPVKVPQHVTSPPDVRAQALAIEVATATAPVTPGTTVGGSSAVVVLTPTCPAVLFPQHVTFPSAPVTQATPPFRVPLAAMEVAFVTPVMGVGVTQGPGPNIA